MNQTDARTRILAEATRLFGLRGFGGASVREVVDAAGVTKPTLYYWFESKERLFVEAVQAQTVVLRTIVEDTLGQAGPVAQRLRGFVARYVDTALADVDGCRLMMTAQHPVDEDQPQVDLGAFHQVAVEALMTVLDQGQGQGTIRADVDPCVAALSLLGAANMHVGAALQGMPLPPDVADRIVGNFLHGVSR